MFQPDILICEIHSAIAAEAAALRRVCTAVAAELCQNLRIRMVVTETTAPREPAPSAGLTLHLPAASAAHEHPAWWLAGHLSRLCPHARVAVFIHGGYSRSAPNPTAPRALRRSRSA